MWKDPLTNQWMGPDPMLMWGRGFLCIFPRDADSPHWIPESLVRHREFSGDAQSGGRYQLRSEKDENNSDIALCPVKKAHNTHASPLPTWGQVKSWPQRARSCCDVRHNLRRRRPCFWPWLPYSPVRCVGLLEKLTVHTSPIPHSSSCVME
jgi:hypothetical protein